MIQFLFALTDESNHDNIVRLYNTYHEYMLKYAASRFKRAHRRNCLYDAEDAVQNTFIKLVRGIEEIDFEAPEKEIKNYIFTILTNEIRTILRIKDDILEFDEKIFNNFEENFVAKLEVKENYNKIVKLIEEMDEKYSITLFYIYCKKKTVNEVAEIMGLSTKTVYTRLARGKQILAENVKGAKIDG